MTVMTRRRTGYKATPHPEHWQVAYSYPAGRVMLEPGTQVKIRGERGVFAFVRHVTAPPRPGSGRRKTREWIDVIGGTPGVTMYRSFRPDRIGKVLRARPVKTIR